jgi:hypothetical protein
MKYVLPLAVSQSFFKDEFQVNCFFWISGSESDLQIPDIGAGDDDRHNLHFVLDIINKKNDNQEELHILFRFTQVKV